MKAQEIYRAILSDNRFVFWNPELGKKMTASFTECHRPQCKGRKSLVAEGEGIPEHTHITYGNFIQPVAEAEAEEARAKKESARKETEANLISKNGVAESKEAISELRHYAEKAEQQLKSRREDLAAGATQGFDSEACAELTNKVAEAEGYLRQTKLMLDVAEGNGIIGVISALLDNSMNYADDTWSGRRNDARRAYADGVRQANQNARYFTRSFLKDVAVDRYAPADAVEAAMLDAS